MDRGERLILHQFDQRFLHQLENCHEGDHHTQLAFLSREQLDERHEAASLQPLEHFAHALAGRQRLTGDLVALEQVVAAHDFGHGDQ
ncbi:hypothetical protein D3C81_1549500 [compost metagenome]